MRLGAKALGERGCSCSEVASRGWWQALVLFKRLTALGGCELDQALLGSPREVSKVLKLNEKNVPVYTTIVHSTRMAHLDVLAGVRLYEESESTGLLAVIKDGVATAEGVVGLGHRRATRLSVIKGAEDKDGVAAAAGPTHARPRILLGGARFELRETTVGWPCWWAADRR